MYKADVLKKLELIPDDEPLFLLRGRDPLAAAVVGGWCDDAESACVDPAKVADARKIASVMADYPGQKLPD